MTPPVQNEDLLATLQALRQFSAGAIETLARLDERLSRIEIEMGRVSTAIYGNGQPGIRAQMYEHEMRLLAVEKQEMGCPAGEMKQKLGEFAQKLAAVETRHAAEDESAEEKRHQAEEERRERKKFRYGLATTLAAVLLDIVLRILGVT